MNAGIITLFDLNNVGNRLQNYAVSSVLKKMGIVSETLVPRRMEKTEYEWKRENEMRKMMENNIIEAQSIDPRLVRRIRFQDFTKKLIPYRQLSVRQFDENIAEEYEYISVGSDQVWNPLFRSLVGQLNNHLLAFVPAEKRVCFAPSIGMDDIPNQLYPVYEKELTKFRFLSCRESAGSDLLHRITGRDVITVIDPTLMIRKEEWESLSKPLENQNYEKGYILYYLLGEPEIELPRELYEYVNKEALEKELEIVRLFDPEDNNLLSAGPEEFLYLISHAALVVTDSFHGMVFTILFGKPFLLVDRMLEMRNIKIDMSSRMNSVLIKLGLQERLPAYQVLDEEHVWNCDYDRVYIALNKERQLAQQFLNYSFGLERFK